MCQEVLGQEANLHKDCTTRWSSTVRMLTMAVAVQECLPQMLPKVKISKRVCNTFVFNSYVQDAVPRWTFEEWELLENITSTLAPTILALDLLEGENYPTQSMILTLIVLLEQEIDHQLSECILYI